MYLFSFAMRQPDQEVVRCEPLAASGVLTGTDCEPIGLAVCHRRP